MVLKTDDCGDKPDERDDGFWPSRDRNAAGYVEPSRFAEAQTAAKERMAALESFGATLAAGAVRRL